MWTWDCEVITAEVTPETAGKILKRKNEKLICWLYVLEMKIYVHHGFLNLILETVNEDERERERDSFAYAGQLSCWWSRKEDDT
jgi:hypothetical protein